VVGQVQKRLVVEDPEEKHPYLVQCLFSGQSVPMMASAWFSAGELVEPARAEIAAWIPDRHDRQRGEDPNRPGC